MAMRQITAVRPHEASEDNPRGRPDRFVGLRTEAEVDALTSAGWQIVSDEPAPPTRRQLAAAQQQADQKHDALLDQLVERDVLTPEHAQDLRRGQGTNDGQE